MTVAAVGESVGIASGEPHDASVVGVGEGHGPDSLRQPCPLLGTLKGDLVALGMVVPGGRWSDVPSPTGTSLSAAVQVGARAVYTEWRRSVRRRRNATRDCGAGRCQEAQLLSMIFPPARTGTRSGGTGPVSSLPLFPSQPYVLCVREAMPPRCVVGVGWGLAPFLLVRVPTQILGSERAT